jgi:hypothetical protein
MAPSPLTVVKDTTVHFPTSECAASWLGAITTLLFAVATIASSSKSLSDRITVIDQLEKLHFCGRERSFPV